MKTTRTWYMAAAAAVVLVLMAGWFLLISPRNAATAELRTQTATAESTAVTLRAQLAQLRTQAAGLAVEQQRLRTFEDKMPATVALPSLIRALNGAATQSGAELISLTPGAPMLPTATAPAATAPTVTPTPGSTAATPAPSPPAVSGVVPGAGAAGGAAPYSVVPLAFTAKGTYFVLQKFFSAVEALPRALLLTSVGLAPADAAAADAASAPMLTATLSGSAYVSALPPVPVVTAPGVVPTPAVTTGPPSAAALVPRAAGSAGTRK